MVYKFHCFLEDLANGVHDLSSDEIKLMLTNDGPNLSDCVFNDINEINVGNGYPSGGFVLENTTSQQTSGLYKFCADDVFVTASGGQIGPFKHIVLYNNDTPNKNLMVGWQYLPEITLNDGQTLKLFIDSDCCVFNLV